VLSFFSRSWRRTVPKLFLLVLFLGSELLHAQFRKTPWPQRLLTPSLEAKGSANSSSSVAKGLPVLLNFWATWCEPCKLEMPSLDTLADWEGEGHLQVLAIDVRENSDRAERFLAQRNLHLKILQDPDAQVAKRFGVSVYPTTILIDTKGQARWKIEGPVDWTSDEAHQWIDALSKP